MKNKIYIFTILFALILTLNLFPIVNNINKVKAQMTDSCSDGKVLAIDITNNRYKCVTVPVIVNSINVDLTTQSAAIPSTLLYAVPSNGVGIYKVTWIATITRAATVSSALGGTGLGLQVIYTNSDDSTLITTPTNLSGAVNVANIIGSSSYGDVIIYAKAGTNINYQIGYTSVGATSMQYSLHIRLQALQ